jgi:hypothetical protein
MLDFWFGFLVICPFFQVLTITNFLKKKGVYTSNAQCNQPLPNHPPPPKKNNNQKLTHRHKHMNYTTLQNGKKTSNFCISHR